MAELATIARPYAEALYKALQLELARQPKRVSDWTNLLDEMAQVAAHPDFRQFASNPLFAQQQVIETFQSLLTTPPVAESTRLTELLAKGHRFALLPEIARQFKVLAHAGSGARDAHVETAFPLTGAEVAKLLPTLEKRFGGKLVPVVDVNAELIGGIRVTVGDEVLDTSVRAKLDRLKNALVA